MKKEYLNPKDLSKPGSYTHAVTAAGAAKLVCVPEAVAAYREVRARYLKPGQFPASTLVGVTRLVQEDLLLEVEVMAALDDRKPAKKTKKKR
jgi:hypothetical protein